MKLVRDGLRNVLQDAGEEVFVAPGHLVEPLLRGKLLEELGELAAAKFQSAEEYADVLQVLQDLARENQVEWGDVEEARRIKKKDSGGFGIGVVLV
ncbi:MAG: hypothetical protein MI755_16510 [Sphingomonadales bacterium]|nr:hypothetical protein [Sphingomonadales bacterium]